MCTHTSHNDLAAQIRAQFQNQLDDVDLLMNGSGADPDIYGHEWQTDIPRLRAGKVGAQVLLRITCLVICSVLSCSLCDCHEVNDIVPSE